MNQLQRRTLGLATFALVASHCGGSDLAVNGAGDGGVADGGAADGSGDDDSGCGPSEYCSPSRGYCGGVEGFYCHSSQDTCVDAAKDCSCGGNSCVYAPTVGHFVCGSNVCMG
jgi:hypothetical protein